MSRAKAERRRTTLARAKNASTRLSWIAGWKGLIPVAAVPWGGS
jgi:hypothetical protein